MVAKLPKYVLPGFLSTGLFEKKTKVDFQDGQHGGHLGFSIGAIKAIFDLEVAPILPIKF